jgi:methyl-accepting chemotaxis protein
MSIRYKIFGAFSVVILLACGLAFYGIRGISTAGDQVVRLSDGPLMGINQRARRMPGWTTRVLSLQRSLTDGTTGKTVARFEKLVRNIFDDLSVVRDRGESASVKTAREKAEASLRGWSGAGLKILKPTAGGLTEIRRTFSLMQQGDEAVAAAGRSRGTGGGLWLRLPERGGSIGAEARTALLGIAIGTAFVGFLIAMAFAYSLSKPISTAVKIAERVAAGNFADDIAVRRRDELGRLLRSLAVMRASLNHRADVL